MVGQTELPEDIREHLAACAECRAWWEDLRELVTVVASDSQFQVSAAEAARIENGVKRRLQTGQSTKITPLNWLRLAALAASVIIVAGIGISGYRANWFGHRGSGPDTAVVALTDSQTVSSSADDPGYGLDDDDYSILDRAIDSTAQFNNASALDSLSDEQIQYLESHLDVRGLI
jgi:predicted anti-sigma-YlaC factor YlaD